ncbi:hypothetical protein [Candidatus Xenohaliotis californiensis]
MVQCYFDFLKTDDLYNSCYFIDDCNKYAYDILINRWPNWFCNGILLCASPGGGKTHLGMLWAKKTNAFVVSRENIVNLSNDFNCLSVGSPVLIDSISSMMDTQECLLHLYNKITELGLHSVWLANFGELNNLSIVDFKSRLMMLDLITIGNPGDEIIAKILHQKLFNSGLRISDRVFDYIVKRMPRSFASVCAISSHVNHLVSISGHNPSILEVDSVLNWRNSGHGSC